MYNMDADIKHQSRDAAASVTVKLSQCQKYSSSWIKPVADTKGDRMTGAWLSVSILDS